jgi:hypothetical protein
MPIRVCKTAVTVVRSGDRLTISGGQPFNYTDEEIAQIEASQGESAFDSASIAVAQAVSAASAPADDAKPAARRRKKADGDEDDEL